MTFYTDAQDTAVELLTEFGASLTLTKTAESFNPATSEVTKTETVQTVLAARFDYLVGEIDGDLVQQGDTRFIISAKGMTAKPEAGDFITGPDGAQWRVMTVIETNPAGTSVIYECQCRQ